MARFLIYIPNSPNEIRITNDDLEAVGLSDLIGGCHTMPIQGVGPDEQPGTIYAWPKDGDRRMDYSPDEQEWFPCKADGELKAGRYWIGLWNNRQPTPMDLQRDYPYPGINVELGDGNSWHIPTIKELPSDAIRSDDGSWSFVIQRKYHQIYIESIEWQTVVAENSEFDWGDLVDFLVRCLRLNYMIVPDLVDHLRLVHSGVLLQSLGGALGCELEGVSS